jgi:hypothetical protein
MVLGALNSNEAFTECHGGCGSHGGGDGGHFALDDTTFIQSGGGGPSGQASAYVVVMRLLQERVYNSMYVMN